MRKLFSASCEIADMDTGASTNMGSKEGRRKALTQEQWTDRVAQAIEYLDAAWRGGADM